eukprot:GHVN01096898.1.p1 GENE.GHVN01096898.1~~GHVN01096898.1.p1  ORF type:complete len:122 (+),score=6.82 GHVN01096898.1:182-547(+)
MIGNVSLCIKLVEKVIAYRELCLNCDSIANERDDLDRETLDEMRSHARILNGHDLCPVTHTSPSKEVTTARLPTPRRHSETLTCVGAVSASFHTSDFPHDLQIPPRKTTTTQFKLGPREKP